MEYFVILTTKGPAIFEKISQVDGKVLFGGVEYAVPIEDTSGLNEKDRRYEHIQSIIWSAVHIIQSQTLGRSLPKKKKEVKVLYMNDKSGNGRVTPKNKTGVMGILLGTGIAKMFKSSFGKTKRSDVEEYPEGIFSASDESFKKEKPIEPLVAFEVPDKSEMFLCKFKIVLGEEQETVHIKLKEDKKDIKEVSDRASTVLKDIQKNFYAAEFSFILGLARSKICIKEVGRWLFNSDYTEIFNNLLNIIEMLIAVFINTNIRSLPDDYISADVNAYIPYSRSQDYSSVIYKASSREEAMIKVLECMKELSDKKLVNAAMSVVSVPMLRYFDEVSRVIYSSEFIKYISSVEENISTYKKKSTSEILTAEKKFNCNVCFLFVDVYHRLIKYKLYIAEATDALKKASLLNAPADISDRMGSICTSDDVKDLLDGYEGFSKEIDLLNAHNSRLSELLKATERFKKIKSLKESGIVFPDCIDDFIEMYELTNGIVIITRDNIVLVNGQHVTAVISKKEVLGCIPVSQDTEYPTTHMDLVVSSIYPPTASFVTDIVDYTRVHWIRINFKWDGNQCKFVEAFHCKNVSTIEGLEMRLRSNTVVIDKTLRKRIEKTSVKKSHKRMLSIRAQRELVPTADLYTFGEKNRISECLLFKIKEWIDLALKEYENSLSSVLVSTKVGDVSFERKLLKEVTDIIEYHSPVSKVYTADKNEFTCVMNDPYSLSAGIKVFVEYLSYVYRSLSPKDIFVYSTSAMSALLSVHEIRNPSLSNDEFLELAIGCSRSLAVPESLNKNEFLLSLLMVRFFTIAAPDIGMPNYLALFSPFFLFNSQDLCNLPRCANR